jgi:hypothetical protein
VAHRNAFSSAGASTIGPISLANNLSNGEALDRMFPMPSGILRVTGAIHSALASSSAEKPRSASGHASAPHVPRLHLSPPVPRKPSISQLVS